MCDYFPQLRGFVIEKRLGSGTYASVYKAYSKSGNETFAIKCIKKSTLNKSSTENLLSEIKILKQIKHDYIVQLIDFQWDENFIYLIMEYCPGGDLSSFIKSRRTIPEKYVRRFVQQIACALKHLHMKGIAHMDLKPQNILLTSINNPSLKLADFGFAQSMRENKTSRSLRGSPLYMAPEILKNKVYDSKVDLWSVGVILHEVIFGYAPFVSSSLDELEQKILDDSPIQIPSHIMLSETCKDLLKRLLKRNPEERISFEEFFSHPFVDLDHMASNQSLPKATELLNRAVRADERKDYYLAQKYYLQSIEYLIPAIQFEKDHQKKQEIRDKAKLYLKRAEEISSLIKPKSSQSNNVSKANVNSPNINTTLSNTVVSSNSKIIQNTTASSLTHVSSLDLFQNISINNKIDLLNMTKNDPQAQNAVKLCIDADEKLLKNSNFTYDELYSQYENSISILLPFVKNLPKDENSKFLKLNLENWLSKAEHLKQRLNEQEDQQNKLEILQARESIKEDDEKVSAYYKNCVIS